MLTKINEFPNQIKSAWQIINDCNLDGIDSDQIQNILIAGMGGSAIGGDLVAGLVQNECPIPIFIHRDGGLPAWVDKNTLLVASSYSGNTWETLSAWDAAGQVGAQRLAITTGGKLQALATESPDAELVHFKYESQPRAALGYSFTLLLGALARLGFIDNPEPQLNDALSEICQAGAIWQSTHGDENLATGVAEFFADGIPVILAAEHMGIVARRWTTQINENTKNWAFWNEYPELNHNIIVGFEHPTAGNQALKVLLLASDRYRGPIDVQQRITGELLDKQDIAWCSIKPEGMSSRLAELLWAVWLGDYVSYHLAIDYNVDPTPVEAINYLKSKMT